MVQGSLILNDTTVVWIKDGREGLLTSQDPFPPGCAFDVYLNLADLDVREENLPPMSFLDRRHYLRRMQSQSSLFQGYVLKGTRLLHLSCPLTDHVKEWLEKSIEHGCIPKIFPYLFKPETSTALVIDAQRHTLYKGHLPIFTRHISQFAVQEVVETYTYVRAQYGLDELAIECHLKDEEFSRLREVLPQARQCHSSQLLDLSFQRPSFMKEAIRKSLIEKANFIGTAACCLLIAAGAWQYYDHWHRSHELSLIQQELVSVNSDLQTHKANVPLDKLLPQSYRDRLDEASPIDLFHRVREALGSDIYLSALKWENPPEGMRLSLQVVFLTEGAEATQDALSELKENLEEALPDFHGEIQSLPHGAGDHETFAGTSAAGDLKLSGDHNKATIVLTRRMS